MEIDAARVANLQSITLPNTVTELRKAIGFAGIAKPLYKLVEGNKNTELNWTKEHDDAFLILELKIPLDVLINQKVWLYSEKF